MTFALNVIRSAVWQGYKGVEMTQLITSCSQCRGPVGPQASFAPVVRRGHKCASFLAGCAWRSVPPIAGTCEGRAPIGPEPSFPEEAPFQCSFLGRVPPLRATTTEHQVGSGASAPRVHLDRP